MRYISHDGTACALRQGPKIQEYEFVLQVTDAFRTWWLNINRERKITWFSARYFFAFFVRPYFLLCESPAPSPVSRIVEGENTLVMALSRLPSELLAHVQSFLTPFKFDIFSLHLVRRLVCIWA